MKFADGVEADATRKAEKALAAETGVGLLAKPAEISAESDRRKVQWGVERARHEAERL